MEEKKKQMSLKIIFNLNILVYKLAKYLIERTEQVWTPQVKGAVLGLGLRSLEVASIYPFPKLECSRLSEQCAFLAQRDQGSSIL